MPGVSKGIGEWASWPNAPQYELKAESIGEIALEAKGMALAQSGARELSFKND